jgi:hypothetical protein
MLLSSTEALVQGLEEAAAGRGARDLPRIVRQQLADWRQRIGEQQQQQPQLGLSAAAAAAPSTAAGSDPSSSAGDGSSGGKLMF